MLIIGGIWMLGIDRSPRPTTTTAHGNAKKHCTVTRNKVTFVTGFCMKIFIIPFKNKKNRVGHN